MGTTKSEEPGPTRTEPLEGQLFFEDYDNQWDTFWSDRLLKKYGISDPFQED